jgi:hypothetical protein
MVGGNMSLTLLPIRLANFFLSLAVAPKRTLPDPSDLYFALINAGLKWKFRGNSLCKECKVEEAHHCSQCLGQPPTLAVDDGNYQDKHAEENKDRNPNVFGYDLKYPREQRFSVRFEHMRNINAAKSELVVPRHSSLTVTWFGFDGKAIKISHGTGRPTRTSKMLDPIELEMAISPEPCLVTMIDDKRSGTDVPAARTVYPMTTGGTPIVLPIISVHVTMKYAKNPIHKIEVANDT